MDPSPVSPRTNLEASPRHVWAWAALLVVLVLIVYRPTLGNGFIWDDDAYVEGNTALTSIQGLYDIWFKWGTVPQYYPLVHSTFWIEYHLWGLDPRGYHAVNMLLHATATVLVWRLLARLNVPGAWLAAAIFAVHPICVESVAWITERKNVLSLTFALGSLLAYLRFSPPTDATGSASAEIECTGKASGTPPAPTREGWDYELALALYVAALLSKTVTVSVPAVLLVIYWWKNGRVTLRQIGLLAPLFIIGVAMSYITVWMEKANVGAEGQEWDFSPIERILIAGRALWFYAGKIIWPHPIIFFYPKWTIDAHEWRQFLYPATALAVVIVLWLARYAIGRGPLAAVLIFAGVLTPALGFFNVFPFRYSFVADHFQYHASVALIALAAAAAMIVGRQVLARAPVLRSLAAVAVLCLLALIAHDKTRVYENLMTLYQDTIALNDACWVAHYNLANYLLNRGEENEAVEHFREALRIIPRNQWHRYSLSRAMFYSGQLDEGAAALTEALAGLLADRERAETEVFLADVRAMQERYDESIDHYRHALEMRPKDFLILYNYAMVLGKKGDLNAAIQTVRESIEMNPSSPDSHSLLGTLLAEDGRPVEAVKELETAVHLRPAIGKFREDLGLALVQAGDLAEAEHQLREAIQLAPASADAHNTLGTVLQKRGDMPSAVREFEAALRIDPNHAQAAANLHQARGLIRPQSN